MKTIATISNRTSNNKYSFYESIIQCCCFRSTQTTTKIVSFISRYYITTCTIIVLFIVFIGHRIASYKVNNEVLYKHPLNEIVRECPKPDYEVISSTWTTTDMNDKNHDRSSSSSSSRKSHPRICITTLTDSAKADPIQRLIRWRNFDSLLDMTWSNKLNYCNKYSYILYNESMTLDSSRPPSWSKIRAVRRLLTEESCDWVLWLDADTVIMNSNKRIEDFLPLHDSGIDLILSEQTHKHMGISWNAGAWLIRNTPWSIEFLDAWWNKKEFVQPKGMSESGDNSALVDYIRTMDPKEFQTHIRVPPRCLYNSVAKFVNYDELQRLSILENLQNEKYYMDNDRYHKTDLVAHVAGVNNKITTTALLLEDAI